MLLHVFLQHSSQACDCAPTNNSNYSTTMPLNPVGASTKLNNAVASKGNPDAVAAAMTTTTGCTCMGGVNAGTAAFNNNKKDNSGKVTLETILSSNTKFQAISAIAVAQDGVVNIADQGMLARYFF